jgi:exosortase
MNELTRDALPSAVGRPAEGAVVEPGSRCSLSPWLLLGAPGLAVAALYAPLVPGLVAEWVEFPNLSHGFAIPLIAGYLLWARRRMLLAVTLVPSAAGLCPLLLGLGMLALGTVGEELFLARSSIPVTLLGLALLLGGRSLVRETWLGIAYLAFMIPPPFTTMKLITFQSRLLDATVSAEAVRWLGVPVYRDGVFLHLTNATLEVADACSSVPAIAALLALGVAYASVAPRPLVSRLTLVLATLPLAVMANIIRIVSVTALVYYVGPWTLKTAYHLFNGTVNFLLTTLLLVALDVGLTKAARRWLL